MVDAAPFGLFVSCVEGQPATRYGTRTLIGAERRHDDPRVIDYDPDIIVAIPADELQRYRREYSDMLRDGALVQRSAEDWVAQEELALEQARERAAAKAKAREEAAAAAAAAEQSPSSASDD
jgi:Pyruvate/2-oxoacid:ferredoxin oxidoreductase gamma subunit